MVRAERAPRRFQKLRSTRFAGPVTAFGTAAIAVSGDEIDLEPNWVAVNGVKFTNSRTAARDSAGRLLGHVLSGARRVAAGEVWLFGFNNARSWDARYFGPVRAANLRGVLQPVVTW
jgi:type IV secretory pathway protease TraF